MNVLSIHREILNKFKQREKELPKLEQVYKRLAEGRCALEKNNIIQYELEQLSNTITLIKTNEDYYYYLLEVMPIIEKYKTELNKPIQMDFMGNTMTTDAPTTLLSEKVRLEEQFIIIAQKYVACCRDQVDTKVETTCTSCQKPMLEKMDGVNIVCMNCGIQMNIPNISFSYKDINRINITSRYTYDRRIHFRDCINQFQGKQNSTISPSVFERLKIQFEKNDFIDKEYSVNDYRRYSKIEKRHIYMFLKKNNDANHYEDANLIYHRITGRPLPDISYLEEKLMSDFDLLSELYDETYIKNKKTNRKNFINTQYVLYQLLKKHKFKCDKSDFNFLKTTERKLYHDTVTSTLFTKLGWTHHPTF